MYHLRYLVVYFFLIAGFNSTAQVIGLVLEADGCFVAQTKLERFNLVYPGDSITVRGSLVLITNYYQVFEVHRDSLFVFPRIQVEGFKEKPAFPDLEQILGASPFARHKPVSHGFESLELVWPPARWTFTRNEPICVMWHPFKESDRFNVQVLDLYDEELYASTAQSDSRFEVLNDIVEINNSFREQGFVMLTVAGDSQNATRSGIFYSDEQAFTRVSPCEVNTAAQATLAAIALETYGAPQSVVRSFYRKALTLSDHEVYRILSDAFDKRNVDDR